MTRLPLDNSVKKNRNKNFLIELSVSVNSWFYLTEVSRQRELNAHALLLPVTLFTAGMAGITSSATAISDYSGVLPPSPASGVPLLSLLPAPVMLEILGSSSS